MVSGKNTTNVLATDLSPSTTRTTTALAAQYRPRFKNPHPLPPVSEFALDHILSHTVQLQSEAVAQSLLAVNSHYQRDLRHEIRQALTIEQKIQYLNIRVAKMAQKQQKRMQQNTRRVARSADGKRGDSIETEVAGLLQTATEVTGLVFGIRDRMVRMGKRPDGRYPRLARLFGQVEQVPGRVGGEGRALEREAEGEAEGEGAGATPTLVTPNVTVEPKEKIPHTKGAELNGLREATGLCSGPSSDLTQSGASLSFNPTPPGSSVPLDITSHSPSAREKSAPEEPMDPSAFELLIEDNIAKFRLKQAARRPARNPIRLLYSLALLSRSDMLKPLLAAPQVSTPMVSSLMSSAVPSAKAAATVVETPHLSLHKKLRISSKPLLQQFRVLMAQALNLDNDDLWSSSGIYTESDADLWSSSLDSSSADDMSQFYTSLHKNLRAKHRRGRRFRRMSPSPKHHPLHRTLQPKKSILKMDRKVVPVKQKPVPYRASPRASFASAVAAGLFIRRESDGGEGGEGEEDGDGEWGDLGEADGEDNSVLSDEWDAEQEQTIVRLRQLLQT